MDWFMVAAMVMAAWAVVSVLASERVSRQQYVTAANAPATNVDETNPAA